MNQKEGERGSRMEMASSKRQTNPLPADEGTICLVLP
jgi:hypothetical protein